MPLDAPVTMTRFGSGAVTNPIDRDPDDTDAAPYTELPQEVDVADAARRRALLLAAL